MNVYATTAPPSPTMHSFPKANGVGYSAFTAHTGSHSRNLAIGRVSVRPDHDSRFPFFVLTGQRQPMHGREGGPYGNGTRKNFIVLAQVNSALP